MEVVSGRLMGGRRVLERLRVIGGAGCHGEGVVGLGGPSGHS